METIYSQVTQADRIFFLNNQNESNYYKESNTCTLNIILTLLIGIAIGYSIAYTEKYEYHKNN